MAINVNPPTGPSAPSPTSTDRNIDLQLFTVTGVTSTPIEYAVGDILEREVIYSGNTIESTTWRNVSQDTVLTIVPPGIDIAAQEVSALTDSELRASAIHVIVDNQITTQNATATETVVTTYTVLRSTSAEYDDEDILQSVEVVNSSTTPVTIESVQWKNVTKNTILAFPPNYEDLALMSSSSLTDAELRASPVNVYIANPASPTPTTTSNQIYTDSYTAIADDTHLPEEYSAGDRIRNVIVVDPTATPSEISNTWHNVTQDIAITNTPPNGATLAVVQNSSLTDQELRAEAVHVIVDNQIAVPSATDISIVTETYTVVNNSIEYNVGDVIRRTTTIDNTSSPALITEEWYNVTQSLALTVAPSAGDIAVVSSTALTDAELRATPIDVNINAFTGLTDAELRAADVNVNTTNEYALTEAQLRASAVEVFVTNQPSPVTNPTTKEIYVDAYTALADDATAPIEYSAGDRLQNIVTVDTSSNPVVVTDNRWHNVTTGLDLTSAPDAATIAATPNTGLTDQELRAAAIHVVVDNQVIPGSSVTGQEMVTEQYVAINSGTGYSANDVLRRTIVADTSANPIVISSDTWFNVTTDTSISAPLAGDIAVQTSNPLTNDQLRSEAIHVIVDNQVQTQEASSLSTVKKLYTTNKADQDGTDYAKDDILSSTEVVDNSATPASVLSVEWRNVTQGDVVIGTPDGADLILTPNNSLTNAELRASDLNVNVTNAFDVDVDLFNVSNSGTGYTKGDVVKQITTYRSDGTSASVWFNVSTQQNITEPTVGDITIASGSSISTVINHYVSVSDGTGVTTNDELECVVQYDNSQTPPLVLSETWKNLSTGLDLATEPGTGTYRVYSGTTDKQKHVVSLTNVTEAAIIPEGAYEVCISNIGFAAGIIEGATFPAGFSVSYKADTDDYLEAISFDATGTEFLVSIQLEINPSTPNPGVAQPLITYPASGTTVPA